MATIVPFSVFSSPSIKMALNCCGIHRADSFVLICMPYWQRGLFFFQWLRFNNEVRQWLCYLTYWLIVRWRKDEAFVAGDLNLCPSLGFCGFWCLGVTAPGHRSVVKVLSFCLTTFAVASVFVLWDCTSMLSTLVLFLNRSKQICIYYYYYLYILFD